MKCDDRFFACLPFIFKKLNLDKEMLALFIREVKIASCEVPKQLNGCDCGVYVVKFVKMILDVMPRTTLVHLKDDLHSQLNKDAFTQSNVDTERHTIRTLIER
jgi:Ulp1 family protease